MKSTSPGKLKGAELADLQCLISESLLDDSLAGHLEHVGISRPVVLQSIGELLSFGRLHGMAWTNDVIVRLVIHLSPPEAIRYDTFSRSPRWKLVKEYLEGALHLKSVITERLSRKIAEVLESLEIERDNSVSRFKDRLLERQKGRCGVCGIKFRSLERRIDLLKPHFESWEELTQPEVDHREPISGLGNNDPSNLQVLCRLCNWGKGFGLVPSALEEYEYAAVGVELVPRVYRARVAYLVMSRDGRCVVCDRTAVEVELTLGKVVSKGGYTISNLRTFCVDCSVESRNIKV